MGKACWACKKKKIRCDLTTPSCASCVRSATRCEYGTQLSWPRKDDKRRNIIAHPTSRSRYKPSNQHFLNVGYSDVIGHYFAALSRLPPGHGQYLLSDFYHMYEDVPTSLSWIPTDGDTFDQPLLFHYEHEVAKMLTSADDARFQSLLLSMSFTDSSSSSVAVRQALYALTALHLYGYAVASKYKGKAIRALDYSHSLQTASSMKDRLQHIAADLLLGLFEMQETGRSTLSWAPYVCNAKVAAGHVYTSDRRYEGDVRILLEWIFYHDALSRFSASHWTRRTAGVEACMADRRVRRALQFSGGSSKILPMIGCSAEILETTVSICDHVYALSSDINENQQVQSMDKLERKLIYAEQFVPSDDTTIDATTQKYTTKIAELYRLAGLIYLYRACMGLSPSSPKLTSTVERAFDILRDLETCDRPFPLIIIASEAQSDEDRLMVLDLLQRSRATQKIGNLGTAQQFIEAYWAQDDLDTRKELNYVHKFDAVISTSEFLPSFA